MPNTVRIKRRLAGGAAGAPSTLENAELAFNEQDSTMYYGVGNGGAGGSATSILAIAGPGAFATLGTTQTISGNKTLSGLISMTGSGVNSPTAVTQSVNDNSTRLATTAFVLGQANSTAGTISMDGAQSAGVSNLYARADHVHPSDTSRAPTASPTFTGTPAAPTAAVDTNTTQIATTAFVVGQASSSAPAALSSATIGTSLRYARADHAHAMPTLSQVSVPTADVSLNSFKITNLAPPTNGTDAANKDYVDAARSGLDVKQSVRVASTANVSVTYSATGGTSSRGQITAAPNTLDGVSLALNDRILLKDQSTGAQNGIWVVSTVGTGANGVWDRATDFDQDAEVTGGAFVFVTEGTANADNGYVLTTNDPIVIGGASGTALAFAQFSGAGQITAGAGLTKTGNTIDVVSANSGRIVVNADNIDLASGVIGTPGTYRSVTVDTYGRVTGGTNPTTFSGYGISDTAANLAAAITGTTGTGNLVFATSPTFTTPLLGTPTSGTLTNCTGLPISTGVSGLGTGVATFLATPTSANLAGAVTDETGSGALVFANTPTLVTPILGTPTSGTLTNCTGLPISTGVSGLAANVATFLGTPSSANLAAAVTDETGSGALVFGTSPSLTTPALAGETFSTTNNVSAGTNAQGQGALTSDYNVVTTTASNPSGVTLPTATQGRRVIVVNKGTNPISVYPATGASIDALSTNAAVTVPVSGIVQFNASSTTQWYSDLNALSGVYSFSAGTTGLTPSSATTGAVTLGGTLNVANGGTGTTSSTGSGSVVLSNSPTLVTPALGTPASGTLTNCTGLPISSGVSGLGTGVATFLGTPSSANLLAAITDETGTGTLVFNTSPNLTTPALSGETFSTTANVSAGTNSQGQGSLTSDYNVITTAASNPSGVTLPTATTGRRIVVVNKGANAVNVYPASGATIDALGANTAISLPVNAVMEFNASSTTQWYSSFNLTVSGTGVTTFSGGSTGLTPNSATSGAITLAGVLAATNGGTGVNNGSSTITLGGSLAFSGAFSTTFTVTGATTLTLPTSGTLLSDGSVIDGGTF